MENVNFGDIRTRDERFGISRKDKKEMDSQLTLLLIILILLITGLWFLPESFTFIFNK